MTDTTPETDVVAHCDDCGIGMTYPGNRLDRDRLCDRCYDRRKELVR